MDSNRLHLGLEAVSLAAAVKMQGSSPTDESMKGEFVRDGRLWWEGRVPEFVRRDAVGNAAQFERNLLCLVAVVCSTSARKFIQGQV
jgi:hypothetical protein